VPAVQGSLLPRQGEVRVLQGGTKKMQKCSECNKKEKYLRRGLCGKHYYQIKRYGKILKRTTYDKNEIIIKGEVAEIYLYNKLCEVVAVATIDVGDLKKIINYKWRASKTGHVCSEIGKKTVYLHQLILGKRADLVSDHIDRNPLNNRRGNLRHVTRQQNSWNMTAKGFARRGNNAWQVIICHKTKYYYVGTYKSKEQAIIARMITELMFRGEYSQYANLVN